MAMALAPEVTMPVGQAVQLVAPAAAYVPAAHAAQEDGEVPLAQAHTPVVALRLSVSDAPK